MGWWEQSSAIQPPIWSRTVSNTRSCQLWLWLPKAWSLLWVTCSCSVYPPSPFFFFHNIQSEPHKPQYGVIALTCQYQEQWPSHHHKLPSIQWAGTCRICHQFPFFTGFVFRNHSFYSWALVLKEKGVSCGYDLPSWGRALSGSSPEER